MILRKKISKYAKKIHLELLKQKEKVVTCESFTGGSIASAFIAQEHASKVFLGGYVPYSIEQKQLLLMNTKNIYSKHYIRLMLTEIGKKTSANYIIATSGNAGKMPADNQEQGKIYFGFLDKRNNFFFIQEKFIKSTHRQKIIKDANFLILKEFLNFLIK